MRRLHAVSRNNKTLCRAAVGAGLVTAVGCHTHNRTFVSCSSTSLLDENNSVRTWSDTFLLRKTNLQRYREQRIKREEFGWAKWRTGRARALASDDEVRDIATLINDLVDLESWEEDQEQELFEHAVSQCIEEISPVLPPPFHDLLHTRNGCLEKETVDLLSSTLLGICRKRCEFPYLDEQDKRRIIRAVVAVIMEAMKEGKDLESFAKDIRKDVAAQEIIVEVFIEGAMDVFFDDEMRQSLVSDVTSYIDGVPFVPHALIEKLCDRIMIAFSGVLHEALKKAFKDLKEACARKEQLPVLPAALDEDAAERDKVLACWKGKPFVVQLRRIFVDMILEREKELHLLAVLPQRVQARLLGRMVDLIFEYLPGLSKIEDTVQPFHMQNHSHHGHEDLEASKDLASQPLPEISHEVVEATRHHSASPSAPGLCQPCFFTLQQPFGFAPSVAATYLRHPEASPRTDPVSIASPRIASSCSSDEPEPEVRREPDSQNLRPTSPPIQADDSFRKRRKREIAVTLRGLGKKVGSGDPSSPKSPAGLFSREDVFAFAVSPRETTREI